MLWAATVAALLAATPTFITRGDVTPEAELRREAETAWRGLEARYVGEAGGAPAKAPGTIILEREAALPPERNAQGRPGRVELRQNTPGVLDERLRLALRHELAHQLLWWACPQSSEDRLFHEAFAVAVSGELAAWKDAPYLSLSRAASEVASAPAVDTPLARRGLARILGESVGFPKALSRRLRQCQDGARWVVPLTIDELAEVEVRAAGPATVVLSRHSGEVLLAEGDVRRALPYGSTLKPFIYAAASWPPVLKGRLDPTWFCSPGIPYELDGGRALQLSCNGYFLDWEKRGGAPEGFGKWGPVLEAVGLTGTPEDMADAIGLRSTLALSPWGMAQAYRLLAEARPDVVTLLRDTATRGTLSKLPVSKALAGVATKTGTVRDAASRPQFGWIAAVDADLVVVAVRPGKMPRHFAEELPAVLARARRQAGLEAARVQVLGLVPAKEVEARCSGAGFAVRNGWPHAAPVEWTRLEELTSHEAAAVCLGAPWRVRFPKLAEEGRDYAGVFTWSPPPAYRPPPGVPTSPSALKARRGSDFVFRTTRLQYTAGVVAAEDVTLKGEPRVALARVVAHNEQHSRHRGRPVCDTTHCQAFRGTVRVQPEEAQAVGKSPLKWKEWLLFSQGGEEPWKAARPRVEVERLVGRVLVSLHFEGGRALFILRKTEGEATFESAGSLPCDLLRSGLKLPSCPRTASFDGPDIVFEGRGRGHGEGLDVEAAKVSGLKSDAILEEAYGKRRPVLRDDGGR